MSLDVAIVGCGLIGQKRAKALGGATLAAAVDVNLARAEALAQDKAPAFIDWREAISLPGVDAVIISTLHNSLAEIARGAIAAGKHVLMEKPGARQPAELADLPALAAANHVVVRVGFNHRYHRAFRKARELVDSGALGPLMFVRARYGHGGRVGYDREWRSDPALSGGGELIDQGVHLIDLARWFLGDFTEVDGYAHTYFWDMPVDDNAFLLLKTANQQVAHLHASCTEWKNIFSFEIYGRTGKLHIEGLGGSYGVEQLSFYKMLPEMGPPETQIWQYPMADDSWNVEMAEFIADIEAGRPARPGLGDAIAALEVVEAIYRKSGYDYRA
jgi:predicted dehydrogenase